ncbi:MAG: hypothetical protein HC876_06950 [Chloroflexaceae bacterium]|nr:hypothetical protein [Chloroflexaceae bacterium]
MTHPSAPMITPPPLPAGSYILQLGLYDVSTWARLPPQNVPHDDGSVVLPMLRIAE